MTTMTVETAWARGRLDRAAGPSKVLFGRMYEDADIEQAAFRPGGSIFCIASAGCTAMKLSRDHRVVAVDINPAQLDYVRRRLEGSCRAQGAAERFMAFARRLGPLVGWRKAGIRTFLQLDDPKEQIDFWCRRLDTRRFRAGFDMLMSAPILKRAYHPDFLEFLPPRFGRILRGRIERCTAVHPNRTNPYAHALLSGEAVEESLSPDPGSVQLVHADAVDYLEQGPAGGFNGFTLSNILDGARAAYVLRLFAAVRRAAAPGAVVVIRSFREASGGFRASNRAAEDRSMLWGTVDVREAAALPDATLWS